MEAREARYRARHDGITRPSDVTPEAIVRVLRVPPETAGMRLDRFIQRELRATSRSRSQLIIASSAYSVSGRHLKKNHRVRAEERIVLWRPPWDEDAPDVTLDILHEDDALVAVNKPPFIVVHPTARHHRSTVAKLLEVQRPDDHLTLLHRIDRETSGTLLLARTRAADRAVKIQFEERKEVVKRYLALCWGWPEWERHTCENPLESDEGGLYRVKMRCAPAGSGLPSATTFEVLERRRKGERRYAMLRCTLHTGRQHQIRVHLASLGVAVVGDKLYGPDETCFGRGADGELTDDDRQLLEHDRQALHACDISLDHPTTGERITIEAPLYPDLRAFWDALAD
jgi:23S rRNA pseudouridine1911/1915/1917 synthase